MYPLFQTSTAVLKELVEKIKNLFAETSLRLSFADFLIQSFPIDLILLGPVLKKNIYYPDFPCISTANI